MTKDRAAGAGRLRPEHGAAVAATCMQWVVLCRLVGTLAEGGLLALAGWPSAAVLTDVLHVLPELLGEFLLVVAFGRDWKHTRRLLGWILVVSGTVAVVFAFGVIDVGHPSAGAGLIAAIGVMIALAFDLGAAAVLKRGHARARRDELLVERKHLLYADVPSKALALLAALTLTVASPIDTVVALFTTTVIFVLAASMLSCRAEAWLQRHRATAWLVHGPEPESTSDEPTITLHGPEAVGELRELWRVPADHHHRLSPERGPARPPEESWRLQREQFREMLVEDGAFLVFARRGERLVGFAAVSVGGPDSIYAIDRVGVIAWLAVLPEERNRGVGSGLLELSISKLEANEIRHVEIGVAADNAGARRLYRRFGFKVVGHVMRLHLGGSTENGRRR